MNDFVHSLPPRSEECLKPELQGLLEIEVSHLCFVTLSSDNGKFSCGIAKEANEKSSVLGRKVYDSCNKNINPNKNLKIVKEKSLEYQQHQEKVVENQIINLSGHTTNCVQVKFVWFGERKEDAANLCISCESQQQHTLDLNWKSSKRNSHQVRKHKHRLFHQSPLSIKSANNTLRYRVCTTETLFLEYLRSCRPIQIIVTSGCGSNHFVAETLGLANLRLPQVLLKKFAFNIAKGHNFEHKTKIYTLYRRNNGCQFSQIPPSLKQKSGEIQLRFKMLFAPSAAVAAATAAPLSGKHHTSNVLHDKKLTSSALQHHHHHHHNCHHHHPHMVKNKAKVAEHVSIQGDKSKRLSSQSKSEDIVEAMKKLDAKLVAYLAGETEITSKLSNCEEENQVNLNLENNNNSTGSSGIAADLDDLSPATKLNVFKDIKGIKLEMEALTLQPDGTKSMKLMQNEIRPIFTVECQLSNELIKKVPRSDMFHIMQFESEKFQSLTQCTRFGQEAERSVKLDVDENGNADEMNLGRIYFTVWWREPGTCLNEMLGMGSLELTDLYKASLLQQCKRIEIQRRGQHLACLYFKITLQRDCTIKRELFLPKNISCDSGDEKSPKTTDKPKSSEQQHQQKNQAEQCGGNKLTAEKSSTEKASAKQNNNTKLQTANFDDETSKIRLLKGFVYANESRNLEEILLQKQKFLICRRFWLDEPAAVKADDSNKFNYQEQFSVINDEKFLQRVDKQFLHLELWHRMSSDDGNGNTQLNVLPLGVVRIPLHQFFIAYRDAAITNHLCKGKLPVISIDAWAPIINWETGVKLGELKCLLAVGSDEQIKNLKETKGLTATASSDTSIDLMFKAELLKLQPLQIATTSAKSSNASSPQSSPLNNSPAAVSKMKKTSDLLDMLQKVLMSPPTSAVAAAPSQSAAAGSAKVNLPPPTDCPSVPCTTALKPLQPLNVKLFKFTLEIQKALGLPLNPAFKAKKSGKQRNSSKRFPPNEPPSTYVTFQADEGQYQTYKSHEGMVFATNIAEKTTQPQWQQRFRLAATLDYLNNPLKRFILKVWKKSALDMAQGRNQPTPMEDAIIGFAALDLSVFMRGLHIGGRFNIVDFNGRINGQLEIRCQPLQDIPATASMSSASVASTRSSSADATSPVATSVDSVIDQFEETLDLTHLNLGQAIKRKFTELEGISQRLRARLGDVTGTEIPTNINMDQFDTWQPFEKDMNDTGDLDEFENDLNTPVVEENDKQLLGEEEDKDKVNIDNGNDDKRQGNCEIDKLPSSE